MRPSFQPSSASFSSSDPRAIRSSSRSSSAALVDGGRSATRRRLVGRPGSRGVLGAGQRPRGSRCSHRSLAAGRRRRRFRRHRSSAASSGPPPVVHLLDGVEPDFDLLEERDFIRRSAGSTMAGATEYAIKHALTREVAYSSIPKARRGRLHAALADWLCEAETRRRATRRSSPTTTQKRCVPRTWTSCGPTKWRSYARVRDQAVRWLAAGRKLARGRHELDDAVELFTRALELSDDAHERARFWREIGEAHALRYDGERMRAALLHALEGPLGRRGACRHLRLSRLPVVDPLGDVRDPPEPTPHRRVGRERARARGRRQRGPRSRAARAGQHRAIRRDATRCWTKRARWRSLSTTSSCARTRSAPAARPRSRDASSCEAATWSEQRLELLAAIDDPDHRCEAYESRRSGRRRPRPLRRSEAPGRASRGSRAAAFTASPRAHGFTRARAGGRAGRLGDARVGDRTSLGSRRPRTSRHPVSETLAISFSAGSRISVLGDEARAAELERDARRVAGEGFESYLAGPMLRMAWHVRDRLGSRGSWSRSRSSATNVWGVGAVAAHLDALVALRRRELIERRSDGLARRAVDPRALRASRARRRSA